MFAMLNRCCLTHYSPNWHDRYRLVTIAPQDAMPNELPISAPVILRPHLTWRRSPRDVVPPGGLEPPAYGLEVRRSVRLSYGGSALRAPGLVKRRASLVQ